MLFKLSLKNIKKSLKDYMIYFLTLMLGVAIFYIFNSLDSQEAMMNLSSSTRELIEFMLRMLAGVSIFISFILGFLIVYANNFLIKRRKKEFGIYMTLGMGKRQISKILLGETILIGLLSLVVGLVIGVFGSQLMSILVAKMFESDMSQYQFVFSKEAMLKTALYFGIMYIAVAIFNTFAISKYKLIDLITAIRKNEKVKLKNAILSVFLFIASIAILGFAYYTALSKEAMQDFGKIYLAMGLGVLGTFLFFWSLSGFILKLVQSRKKLYFKDLNIFVLRQINSKINTTVFSMTIISLLLFVTICVLSSAWSLNDSMKKDLRTLTPADISISKHMDLPETYISKDVVKNYSQQRRKDSTISIEETLTNLGFDISSNFQDYVEITGYTTKEITRGSTLGDTLEEVKSQFKMLQYDTPELIIKLSDYNKVAKLYGHPTLFLENNQYIMLCDYDRMKQLRDKALEKETPIIIDGQNYYPKEKACVSQFVEISSQHMNTGIIVVPDEAVVEMQRVKNYFNAKYRGETEEEKAQIEQKVLDLSDEDKLLQEKDIQLDAITKITIYEASRGLGAIVTFIALYLGIIFLISGAAILALKELSESSDNKQRYDILRKIGADEKRIYQALFRQIGVFFVIPLGLAIVHSIFGLQFANQILQGIGKQDMLPAIIATAVFIVLIYGGYFIATYLGSKNIIKDNTRK